MPKSAALFQAIGGKMSLLNLRMEVTIGRWSQGKTFRLLRYAFDKLHYRKH